jgi:hypothetical protein
MHYQSLCLDDLYNQLTIRLGFPFEHKLFRFPDFYNFVLYYCANIATVQYAGNSLVVYSNYHQHYQAQIYAQQQQQHQTHRSTYSQEFPSQNYPLFHSH